MASISFTRLRRQVIDALVGVGGSVSCAESCTGGLIAAALTEEGGSSIYFIGGVVAYANVAKRRMLGVSPDTLAAHGAVSPETAVEMARGCLGRFGTDFAVAVTGVAGPGGGGRGKPVGLVYLAVAVKGGVTRVYRHRYKGTRRGIRQAARRDAFVHLLEAIQGAGVGVREERGGGISARYIFLCMVGMLLGAGVVARGGVVYGESGGWGVALGPRGGWAEVAPGRWMGRVGEGEEVEGLPPAPVVLRGGGNPWRGCLLKTLSVRYGGMLGWVWSRTGLEGVGEGGSFCVRDAGNCERVVVLELRDEESGRTYKLRPEHRLRQGRVFSRRKGKILGDVLMFAGGIEGGAVTWQVVAAHTVEGGYVLQGRVASMDGAPRFFSWSVGLRGGGELFVTPEEPRRHRRWRGDGGEVQGFTFDLACTERTENFPGMATFSVGIGEAPGGKAVCEEAPVGAVWIWPSVVRVAAPDGERFRSVGDVFDFVRVRSCGIFPDANEWLAAWACLARDARGGARVRLVGGGESAVGLVNCDPDFETGSMGGEGGEGGEGGAGGAGGAGEMRRVHLQENRATALLERCLRAPGDDVVVVALGGGEGAEALDFQSRALRMADYPAVWGETAEGGRKAGVPLVLVEQEFIASLRCALHKAGKRLWVVDDGEWARYTTFYADGVLAPSVLGGVGEGGW